jgi:hypothetical protein
LYGYASDVAHKCLITVVGALLTGLAVATPGRAEAPTMVAERASGPSDLQEPSLADQNRLLAGQMSLEHGWTEARQWHCLDRLWTRESGWNHLARNRGSGAYGIPQALPGSKMSSAGPDWRTSAATQIRWGLGYIENRYGNPCAAWGHAQAAGWY